MRAIGRAVLALIVVATIAIGPLAVQPANAQVPKADVALAVRFAPHYAIRTDYGATCREGEKFLPIAVEDVLRRDDVAVVNEYGRSLAPGADGPWPENLRAYIDLPGSTFDGGCSYSRWFDAFRDPENTVVYARIASESGYEARLALQYWTFWPYNDWNGKHEGDWELVQLTFAASDADEALEQMPLTVTFAQHSGFETREWGDGIDITGERHVVVYSAIGSHAAYFAPGRWFANSPATGLACDETRDPNLRLEPRVVVLGVEPGQEWLAFPGRWGEPHAAFNNGPRGPAFQEPWAKPISWLESDPGQPSVRIPASGSIPANLFCSVAGVASVGYNIGLEAPALPFGIGLLGLLAVAAVVVSRMPVRTLPGVSRRRLHSFQPLLAAGILTSFLVYGLMDWTPLGDLLFLLGYRNPWAAVLVLFIGAPFTLPAAFYFAVRLVMEQNGKVRRRTQAIRALFALCLVLPLTAGILAAFTAIGVMPPSPANIPFAIIVVGITPFAVALTLTPRSASQADS